MKWHLPFVDEETIGECWRHGEIETNDINPEAAEEKAIKVSVARCARVSYLSFETGKRSSLEEDLELYDRLMGAQPLHASPAEHQATPDTAINYHDKGPLEWENKYQWGNFKGWRQYRKMLPNEEIAPLPEEYIATASSVL